MNYANIAACIGGAKGGGSINLKPLRFTNAGEDAATINFFDEESAGTRLQYRTTADGDFQNWVFATLSIPVGGFIEIVGENSTLNSFIGKFAMTGTIAASGNIMTLLYGEDIIIEETLVIPFDGAFGGKSSGLFYGCTSLITAPELPATTLTADCYWNMFANCGSLTTAPKLPATTLTDQCYLMMFANCGSLTAAPELPATTLADLSYSGMFANCTKLEYVKCLATNNISGNTPDWLKNVATSGTFTKAAGMTGWTIGISGIPTGWTVVDAAE